MTHYLNKRVGCFRVGHAAAIAKACHLAPVLLLGLLSCGGSTSPGAAGTPTQPTVPVATSISLSPSSFTMTSFGETASLKATVRDQNGAAMTGQAVEWMSSDASVVTVASGMVSAIANGNATITASSSSLSATATASVMIFDPFYLADSLLYDLVPGEGGTNATLSERMQYYGVPGVSVAVLRNGDVAWAHGFGVKLAGTEELVDSATVFSVASLSKVGTAATTLRLVDAGLLDLDRDVMDYLTSWVIPENPFTAVSPVTLRRLMSHTAGTTVHGFADFQPGEALPTTVQILEGIRPAKNKPVVVKYEPGTRYDYSGGGTTIQQLVIEDVTGSPLAAAAVTWVFDPLVMSRSTFVNPLPSEHGNIARAHDGEGQPTALPRGWEAMPEAAASGLWTSPSDYSRLVIALRDSWLAESGAFLNHALGQDVMTKVEPGNVGLGPFLGGSGRSRYFSHGGSNESYKSYFRVFLESGDGAIVFTNGAGGSGLVGEIIDALDRIEGWPG